MNTPAGWYPDPNAPGQMRYWDGQVWTQQTAPAQQPQQPQQPGTPGFDQGQPGGPGHSEAKKNPAVWIISGLAALLAVSGDDSEEEGTGAADDESGEDAADEAGGEDGAQDDVLEVGESLTVDLAEDDEAVLDMTVEESGVYTVDLSGDAGADPILEVHDADGLLDEVDGVGAELFLLPGDYELHLTERLGEETSADLEVDLDEAIDAEEVGAGDHDFSFGSDGHYVAVVEVPDDSEVAIDVRADDGEEDAVLDVVLPDGSTEYNDDRSSGDPDSGSRWDPYLEFDIDEGGSMVIIVTGYAGESVDGEMSLEIN